MPAEVTAIVPLRSLAHAKQRLAAALTDPPRRALVAWMAQRVLDALTESAMVSQTVAVVGDAQAAALAERHGAHALRVPPRGLAHALHAADRLGPEPSATLVLPADLPWAQPQDIDALTAAVPAGTRGVAVVATADGGTGALLRRPGRVIPTAFGSDSAAQHHQHAAAAGTPAMTPDLPGLARDIDHAADLAALARDAAALGAPDAVRTALAALGLDADDAHAASDPVTAPPRDQPASH